MTESSTSSIQSVANDILISPSHEKISRIVSHLFKPQETEEYKFARTLCDFFMADSVNLFSLRLLHLYQWSSNSVVRFRSIYLLSDILIRLRNSNSELSLVILYEIKPVLISCLTMEVTKESDIKIIGRIVSFVANKVGRWDELRDCILSLADKEPVKAFQVFVGLQVAKKTIIQQVLQRMFVESTKMMSNPDQDRAEYWSLALETIVKSGMVVKDSKDRFKLIEFVHNSAKTMVEKGREEFLERGLEDLKKFLARDSYSKVQLFFIGSLAFQIAGACSKTLEKGMKIATEILKMIENKEKYSKYDHGSGYERDWYDYLKNLSSLQLFRIFASTDHEDRSRELAIRRLNVLLSETKDHLPFSLHISVLLQLQTMIISCLVGKGVSVSDSMFKVLGEVVNNVMCHMITQEGKLWDGNGLLDYISNTRFERAVSIFQCFTMQIEESSFVVPVMNNLLPEIISNLDPPSEPLLDSSLWALAFTGAFCAVVRLIDLATYDEDVKKIAYKMIRSVRELVKRGMEVGVVMRGFRELESLVKKQMEWYDMSEYKFVKGLVWRLYGIKGMRWESKIVLWRINFILERGVPKNNKELPLSHELDWLNQGDEEDGEEEEEYEEE